MDMYHGWKKATDSFAYEIVVGKSGRRPCGRPRKSKVTMSKLRAHECVCIQLSQCSLRCRALNTVMFSAVLLFCRRRSIFLDQLNDCQFLKKDSAAWSYLNRSFEPVNLRWRMWLVFERCAALCLGGSRSDSRSSTACLSKISETSVIEKFRSTESGFSANKNKEVKFFTFWNVSRIAFSHSL
jgi:hypothetical protein